MAHKSQYAKMCKHEKTHDCFNCANRLCTRETKKAVLVTCTIDGWCGKETRTLEFSRNRLPYCGAWRCSNA